MTHTANVLLVEPHEASRGSLRTLAGVLGNVETCATFEAARARLMASPVDFLVTNVRLGAFNGLHLVYLSQASKRPAPRAIVYNDGPDIGLAREAERAGASYVDSLPDSLAAYLDGRPTGVEPVINPAFASRSEVPVESRHLRRHGR
jgi:DNA-binding NarL/FixJ family response regulator